ncbi:ABC transporter permease [Rhodococcus sp. IEGM 1408]|uniref:ABC transporter permease n=1 Tax=Rhodococcus sp. IEGM 1408 TaxID=3082220 RepID=UPI0029548E98|nr:ABC transporter permease [Rhodococcus sp. IEGM 1408]MDV8000767.1 ABC transporter permease [Rhodococcus sp. IEGM 1408]
MTVRLLRSAGPACVTILLVLAVWISVTAFGLVPDYVIPAPLAVLDSLVSTWPGRLGSATLLTATETVVGVMLGVFVALFVVIVSGFVPTIGQAMTPLLVASQAIPVIVIGPLLTISLGYGMAPKVIVVALLCFFPVALNLLAGVRAVDTRLIDTLRSLHATRGSLFWRVRLPSAAPRGFAGLRVSVTFAPVAAVFAEYTGSTNGLGYLMLQAIPRLQTDFVFAQVLVLTVMSSLLLASVTLLERLICPWNTPAGKRNPS